MKAGAELELMKELVYSSFTKSGQRIVAMSRKFLEMIKKKYKDDLMDNLLQEEYSKSTPVSSSN